MDINDFFKYKIKLSVFPRMGGAKTNTEDSNNQSAFLSNNAISKCQIACVWNVFLWKNEAKN